MTKALLDEPTIPREIAEQVLSMGRVEWGATDEFASAGHLAHLEETLRITREHFNFEDVPVPMHGLYLEGTGTVLCHTGTSPNSGTNAQALAGAWNWLHEQCLRSSAPQEPAKPNCADCGEPYAEHRSALGAGLVWCPGDAIRTYVAQEPVVDDDALIESFVKEIESYGEGLVPELRIVCVWLANHFRDSENLDRLQAKAPETEEE